MTVLTGPNSSGKSAILRAMMALRQTVESRDTATAFVPSGSYVDLGAYEEFAFGGDIKSSVSFDVGCRVHAGQVPILGGPITISEGANDLHLSIEIAYLSSSDRIYLVESVIESEREGVRIHRTTKRGKAIGRSYRTRVADSIEFEVDLVDTTTAKFSATPPFHVSDTKRLGNEASRNRLMGTQMCRDVEDRVFRELTGLIYIGPLRERPKRMYISTGETPREVGIAGELGPAVLWSASGDRVLNLKDRASRWCSHMDLGAEIRLDTMYGGYFQVFVLDPNTSMPINLPDVGFGMGQILPILIQGLIAPPGATLLLEQPEIHLHPKVQADLADFLLEVSQRGVGVIVETHSEHLMTRLQRRIAEEALDPEDVALYYVTPSRDGSSLQRVVIDEFGQIPSAPEGFFEEGFEETFKFMSAVGARKAQGNRAGDSK